MIVNVIRNKACYVLSGIYCMYFFVSINDNVEQDELRAAADFINSITTGIYQTVRTDQV